MLVIPTTQSGGHVSLPLAVAFDSQDNFIVTDHQQEKVWKFDSTGTLVGVLADQSDGIGNPWGLVVDSDDNIFVANTRENSILRIDPQGIVDLVADSSDGVLQPFSLAFSPLAPECNDGIDNDGDGAVDFLQDVGCTGSTDVSELEPGLPCDDGVHNDGDGLLDLADPGCLDSSWGTEDPQCQDGEDNDGDGRVDFDGGFSIWGVALSASDPQCAGAPWKNRELPPPSYCGLGSELALALPIIAWARRRALKRSRRVL